MSCWYLNTLAILISLTPLFLLLNQHLIYIIFIILPLLVIFRIWWIVKLPLFNHYFFFLLCTNSWYIIISFIFHQFKHCTTLISVWIFSYFLKLSFLFFHLWSFITKIHWHMYITKLINWFNKSRSLLFRFLFFYFFISFNNCLNTRHFFWSLWLWRLIAFKCFWFFYSCIIRRIIWRHTILIKLIWLLKCLLSNLRLTLNYQFNNTIFIKTKLGQNCLILKLITCKLQQLIIWWYHCLLLNFLF